MQRPIGQNRQLIQKVTNWDLHSKNAKQMQYNYIALFHAMKGNKKLAVTGN